MMLILVLGQNEVEAIPVPLHKARHQIRPSQIRYQGSHLVHLLERAEATSHSLRNVRAIVQRHRRRVSSGPLLASTRGSQTAQGNVRRRRGNHNHATLTDPACLRLRMNEQLEVVYWLVPGPLR